MLGDHRALGQSLAARGGHVVESDHIEHRRPHIAHHAGRLEQAQHRDRHDRLPELLPPPVQPGGRQVTAVDERKPAQVDAEEQDEDHASEEGRQRKTDEGQGAGNAVEPRIGLGSGQDAHRQGHQHGQQLRQPDHHQGHRHALQDQLIDIDAADEAEAPVALEHAAQPAQVALPDRVVQAELHAQGHAHLGRHRRVVGQVLERVARCQRQHREEHDADAQQAGQRDQQAAEDVVEQEIKRRLARRATRGSRVSVMRLWWPTQRPPLARIVPPAASP